MVAITATNSATPALQASLGRARLEQATREASQAEDNARQLRAQADDAEREAQQGQAKVREISADNRRQESTYRAPAKSDSSAPPVKVQNFIENLYKATSQKRAEAGNPLKSPTDAAPVVNVSGQTTGRILNLTA
jgi:type IV secretory pathway VirJ component